MRKTVFATLLLSSVLVAGSAQSTETEPVAGWSFSQYAVDGQLTLDGTSFVNTLPANYSALDPSGNAGSGAASFGTMFANGAFGSTNVNPNPGSSPLIPTAGINNCERTGPLDAPSPEGCTTPNVDGPVRSNRYAPAPSAGKNPFDSHSVVADEGQVFTNLLGITADSATSIVFQADLSGAPGTAAGWALSLGARTFSGTASIGVDFAPSCGGYSPAESLIIGVDDEMQTVSFGTTSADLVCVRLNFPDPAAGQAIIDNVMLHAIPVPEPSSGIGIAACLCGLWAMSRRRDRS